MPIEIKKYTCRFKCGKKAINDRNRMVAHENNYCVKNPENKTCQTCINCVYEYDSDDYRGWHNRGCKIKAMNDFIEEIHEDLVIDGSNRKHVKPLWHCPNHNQNKEQVSTGVYIAEIKEKIENKKKLILENTKFPF